MEPENNPQTGGVWGRLWSVLIGMTKTLSQPDTRQFRVVRIWILDSGLWILGSGEVGLGFGAVVASCSSPANRVSKCPSARWCIFAGLTASAVLISFYLFTHSAPVGQSRCIEVGPCRGENNCTNCTHCRQILTSPVDSPRVCFTSSWLVLLHCFQLGTEWHLRKNRSPFGQSTIDIDNQPSAINHVEVTSASESISSRKIK